MIGRPEGVILEQLIRDPGRVVIPVLHMVPVTDMSISAPRCGRRPEENLHAVKVLMIEHHRMNAQPVFRALLEHLRTASTTYDRYHVVEESVPISNNPVPLPRRCQRDQKPGGLHTPFVLILHPVQNTRETGDEVSTWNRSSKNATKKN